MLTEAQFQTEIGDSWVLMDGRDVSGSRYATLTGSNTIPDATGCFLRNAGGDAGAIGVLQNDATAVNGLGLSWSSANAETDSRSAYPNTGTYPHPMMANAGDARKVPSGETTAGTTTTYGVGRNSYTSAAVGTHIHAVNKNKWNSNQNWPQYPKIM